MRDYYGRPQAKALEPFFARNAAAVSRRFRAALTAAPTSSASANDHVARGPASGVVTADRAEIFPTGAEKFGRLKADLAAAQRFIHIQYFIWEDDELTDALTEILRERLAGRRRGALPLRHLGSIAWDKKKLEALVPLGAQVAR